MDLRQLKYFVKIVELGSISAAANALFVAQPSLSQHVANLESELGTRLLTRGAKGTTPTAAGETLFLYAKSILRQIDEAQSAVRMRGQEPSGRLSIGLPASTMRVIGLEIIRRARSQFPHILLELQERSTAELIGDLMRQRIDVCVVPEIEPGPAFESTPFVDEELLFIGPADQEPPEGEISLETALSHPLIVPSTPNSVRVCLDRACLKHGLSYRLIAETSVVSLLVDAATSGLAWSILPWGAMKHVRNELRCYNAKEQSLKRRLYLCISKGARETSAGNAISSLIHGVARDFIKDGAWLHATSPAPGDGFENQSG